MASRSVRSVKPRRSGVAARKTSRHAGRSRLSRGEIETLFLRLAKKLPEPKGELEYVNPYTLLVAVVLSAQSTDVGVNKATRLLFAKVDTPQKMLKFGQTKLVTAIRSLGFFNMKAKNVMALSRILVEEHGGEVPRDREALQRLPGVGRKTASVVLNIAFKQAVIAVDTHIFRVANRTGLAPGTAADDVADLLERVVPDLYKLHAHHWLILHGRYVCVARKPKCPECVISDVCRFKGKTEPAAVGV